jgi:hypothetical protein
MGGLIKGAKEKIWDIAKHISRGQPTPELRVGLVAYRDLGDEYVTKMFPLTTDLDAVYAEPSALRADGGGDEPEHVSRALNEAVNKMEWSKDAMKMVFLVGDAPPHMRDPDGLDIRAIAAQAAERGIKVNAIRCGDSYQTAMVWQEVAASGGGVFGTIAQNGGVATVTTPYDGDLTALGRRYADTAVIVGDERARARVAAKAEAAAAAPAPIAADRSGYYGVTGGSIDDSDKLHAFATGAAPVEAAPAASLPEPMRDLKPAERKAYVAEKAKQREEIKKEISELTKKRDEYVKKATAGKDDGFDAVVTDAIKKGAKGHGIEYADE